MQGDDASAMRTSPPFFFFTKVLPGARGFDAQGIVNQTDLIPLPVAFIETFDDCTGKRRALEAKLKSLTGRTVFDFTFPAVLRLAGVLPAAAQTRLLLFQVHIADRAGDPAGRQHIRRDSGIHFHDTFTMFPDLALSKDSYCLRYFISSSFAINVCTFASSPSSASFADNSSMDWRMSCRSRL
jgi:hypothetical protein